jgi:hypothetical protein
MTAYYAGVATVAVAALFLSRRAQLLALVPLIAITCGLNAATRGAYGLRGTFSARAGRSLPRCARAIDAAFRLLGQTGHCAAQVKTEDAYGGNVWHAWAAAWGRA